MTETAQSTTHLYLVEVERMDHRFVMIQMRGKDAEEARESARLHLGGLGASIVACSIGAPEYGDTCKRELVG